MSTFLNIQNRYFFVAFFIVWLLGAFFAKFDVAWNTTQHEIFKIPKAVMNLLFLLWMLQKTIKSYKTGSSFGILILTFFWLILVINFYQLVIK